MRESN